MVSGLYQQGLDINGLLYEETPIEKMLPDSDLLNRHVITVEVKREAEELGKFELGY